jgi:hypothetical protein
VGARFHVLRYRTCFRRYLVRGGPFYFFFALPNSFWVGPRAPGTVFMFFTPEPVLGGVAGAGSRLHVLRFRTRFRRYRGCWVPFSCFALPDPFWTISRASCPVFRFCTSGPIFGGTEGVGSHFYVLSSRTRFRRYQRQQVSFSCFALPDQFSQVPRASDPVFVFCAPEPVFDGTEGAESRFHVLLSKTHFRRYRERWVPFSTFTLPDPFWAVPRVLGTVLMFFSPGPVLGGTEGAGYRIYVFPYRTCFGRYRGRQIPFSCVAHSDLFSAVLRASGPVFIF